MLNYTPNPEQEKIINHIQGAILVLAPVGTGKTRVLSERVTQAIKNGIPAQKILCLTFTNRAAKEMTERLAQICPEESRQITVKTFHSLCTLILRIEARQIGLPTDFIVYDDADCKVLIREIFNLSEDKDIQHQLFTLAQCKIKASELELSGENIYNSLPSDKAILAHQYQTILQERHALDFADLIYYVLSMFATYPEIKQRWENRFDFVQVDEVQDTHVSEYNIVKCLASKTGNLAMIGDLDQTIYEWRGSEPEQVMTKFKQDFIPQKYSLTFNYRATQTLLKTASYFANSFDKRHTEINPSPTCEVGELIQFYSASSLWNEAQWIGNKIKNLASSTPNFAYNRVAVLTRTHWQIEKITKVLEELNIPCLTIEQHHFFMRQEVKDALAYLRLIVNPFDTGSLRRILLRPNRGIGATTIQNIINEGQNCGLRLTDMVSSQTFLDGDPFSNLISAYSGGNIVVFDVETTGLEVGKDEVIEIAAIKLVKGKQVAEFHQYIKNTKPVGDSEKIHHYSDLFLAQNGKPAQEVLQQFFDFSQDALLVGHNVGFDIKMVTAYAHQLGIKVPQFQWADTWNLANRFYTSESYSLESLAKQLNLNNLPTHQALDDTTTTVELLNALIPRILKKSSDRQVLVYHYGNEFETLAQQIETWRDNSQQLRPAYLLGKVLLDSRLYDYYESKDAQRLDNIKKLVRFFQEKDDIDIHPDTALRQILEFTALAKNLDQIFQDDNKVPIITVHQAKGLEFDTVFIAGMTEGDFPSRRSIDEGKIEEEKRLFYVALTRAKERLFISGSQTYSKPLSQFINLIPSSYLNRV